MRARRRICARCIWRTVTGENRRARAAWQAQMQVFRDCPHTNTKPNPRATAVPDRNPRICLDCGIGLISVRPPA